MTSPRERYVELLSLTKNYLLQEHSLTDRIFSEKDSYEYFRAFAAQRQEDSRKASSSQPQHFLKNTPKQTPQPQIAPTPPQYPPKAHEIAAPAPKTVVKEPDLPKAELTRSEPEITTKEPVKSETVGSPAHSFRFALSPQTPSASIPMDDLRKIANEHLPHLKFIDAVPDDLIAREISNSWQKEKSIPQIAILSFNEPPNHQQFLSHLSNAIGMIGFSVSVVPALKIDRNKGWEAFLASPNLKFAIGCGNGINSMAALKSHHKENTKNGSHHLGSHPLFVLSDISFYLKEPALKQSLWKNIKDQLAKVAIPHE